MPTPPASAGPELELPVLSIAEVEAVPHRRLPEWLKRPLPETGGMSPRPT